jgi:hypothetical protein
MPSAALLTASSADRSFDMPEGRQIGHPNHSTGHACEFLFGFHKMLFLCYNNIKLWISQNLVIGVLGN